MINNSKYIKKWEFEDKNEVEIKQEFREEI